MTILRVVVPADIRFPLQRANGVQVVKTAAALTRAGVRTTLIVRKTDPRPTEAILALYGVRPSEDLVVRRLRVLHRTGSFLLPRVCFLVRAAVLAWNGARRGAAVYTRDLQLAALLLRMRVRGVVYEAHAVESMMYAERGRLYGTDEIPSARKIARLAAREGYVWTRAAAFVSTTAGIRATFADRHGERDRSLVIPNGCDASDTGAFPGLARERPARVLYAGQLYLWKGVDVLVEAMREVPDARLVIAGGFDAEADLGRLRGRLAGCGMSERTELLGTLPQARVAEELQRAAVVVVPVLRTAMTERHTSPIKAFEGMAAGRPLVVSDLPSSREFLRDGENALLVPPGDTEALARAIRRLLADPGLAERLARVAHSEAPRYSWDARARGLRRIFEDIS